MSRTVKYRGVYHVEARCDDCDMKWYSRNAAGLAAKHHYKTGHTVHVETVSGMTMCMDTSEWHLRKKANE